jgi:hypothetical protein
MFFTFHITYHALRTKRSFFDHCALLELRYLISGHIVNPEEVRFRAFRVNDLLLYIKVNRSIFKTYSCERA